MAGVKCPVCEETHDVYAVWTISKTVCPYCWFTFSPRHGEAWKQCSPSALMLDFLAYKQAHAPGEGVLQGTS